MDTCNNAHAHACTHARTRARTHVHACTHACTHACAHACTRTRMHEHACKHTCAHSRHTCTRIRTRPRTPAQADARLWAHSCASVPNVCLRGNRIARQQRPKSRRASAVESLSTGVCAWADCERHGRAIHLPAAHARRPRHRVARAPRFLPLANARILPGG